MPIAPTDEPTEHSVQVTPVAAQMQRSAGHIDVGRTTFAKWQPDGQELAYRRALKASPTGNNAGICQLDLRWTGILAIPAPKRNPPSVGQSVALGWMGFRFEN